jgi:hypothetical protein
MCDPKWMETDKILRLEKSIHGWKSASKAFMKQLGEEVLNVTLKFVEMVEYKSPGNPTCVCRTQRVDHTKFFKWILKLIHSKLHEDQYVQIP